MAGRVVEWTAGETQGRSFTLYDDAAVATLTGLTVVLELTKRAGGRVPTTGNVAVATATTVTYTPDATDLQPGEYLARFKVTDNSGRSAFYPSRAQEWVVHPR